ncbi:protein-glutamate methylesterase/protein-glutamine glutaminase [Candidatus Halocynthiibacter alkanivorans]|uniref:protein-glutamate methylesterase/protein-glutamine glutaminase n=1 Tax=Candidatus Halocynthiibacter alkanivorans TaxID=2267619 RepID=UPI000DF2F4B8|nr:chemotaxis response regulator protein-glutamate methylesterase [Candidatus Halocynthiibacter alkanivorans]
MKKAKKRVLIVDDSAAVRQVLTEIINADNRMEVMATAGDPFQATERIAREVPDVIVLDVEMPRMDGLTFLRRLMAQRPIPVVICSTLVGAGTQMLDAVVTSGAVDVIAKPALGTRQKLIDTRMQIQDTIVAASHACLDRRKTFRTRENLSADVVLPASSRHAMLKTTDKVVLIGASTGGTEALCRVLESLPDYSPPIVVVQHMPEAFTSAFAQRLNGLCKITVKEARNNDRVMRGHALIAPGGRHTLLTRSGANYRVEVRDAPLVNRHRPSVDVLFRSAAQVAGTNAVGIIMTGMGNDGAHGLKEMRDAGAVTYGQCKDSCVVYGMPAEAKKLGAVGKEIDLSQIAGTIASLIE